MSTNCIENCSLETIEAPLKVSFLKLFEWPYSDAEFLKEITETKGDDGSEDIYSNFGSMSSSFSSSKLRFALRQRYLRSYTFTIEENPNETKMKKCFEVNKLMKRVKSLSMLICSKSFHGNHVNNGILREKLDIMFKFLASCKARIYFHE